MVKAGSERCRMTRNPDGIQNYMTVRRDGTLQKEGQVRIPAGCAISGIFSRKGTNISGRRIIESISVMRERSNGLGGGFAGYGIYPQYKDYFALHIFYDDRDSKLRCETFLEEHFEIVNLSKIPVKRIRNVTDEPLIWRYFVEPLNFRLRESQLDDSEYMVRCMMHVNSQLDGCYIFSCGKNMGVFKAVGYPEDVGEYYRLDEYEGHCWIAHGRYPTNTPGWWGGAHPFSMLDQSVVHNGEISSYDANRRYIEMFGYKCSLQTDTEVISYILDYLVRKQGLTVEETAGVIAAPFWSTIEHMPEHEKSKAKYLRNAFSSLLITGPFSIILAFENGIMALNDRLKLRSMVIGEKDDMVYIASEEAAIRRIVPELDRLYAPKGGVPAVYTLDRRCE